MGKHEELIRQRWNEEILSRNDIKGGDIYFAENYAHVGRIKSFRDNGDSVMFFLEWCAHKTRRGWVRRKRRIVTCTKIRFEFASSQGPITFGGDRIVLKGQGNFDETTLLKPVSKAARAAAKALAIQTRGLGPLFDEKRK